MAVIKRETDYALRALARLGGAGGYLSVSALAEEEAVPVTFLRKTMQRLNRAGIVESRQGPFGGYRLSRPAEQVSLLDVLEAVQGPLVMNECFSAPEICGRVDHCPVKKLLTELQALLSRQLAGVSVSQVVGRMSREEGVRT